MSLSLLRHQVWAISRDGMRALSARYNATASLIERGLAGLSNDERARICYNGGNPIVPEITGDVATVEIMGDLIARAPWWAKAYLGAIDPFDLADVFDALAANAAVSTLVLEVDCCGGTVAGTYEARAALVRFQAAGKAVEVRAAGVLASAAYAMVSPADRIIATNTTMVGSLGTMVVLTDDSAMLATAGIKLEVISTGPLKGLGQDGVISQPMRDQYQRHVDALNAVFKDAVSSGRGIADVEPIFTGAWWIGAEALSLGLIDAIASPADELDAAAGSTPAPAPIAPPLDGGEAPESKSPAAATSAQAPSEHPIVDPKLMATLAALCQTHSTHAAALVAEANKPGATEEGLRAFLAAKVSEAKDGEIAALKAQVADLDGKLKAETDAKIKAEGDLAKIKAHKAPEDPGGDSKDTISAKAFSELPANERAAWIKAHGVNSVVG